MKGLAVAERASRLGVSRVVALAEGYLRALVYEVPPMHIVGHSLDVANIRRVCPEPHALADVDAFPSGPAYVAAIRIRRVLRVIGTDAAAPRAAAAASMGVHATAGNPKHAEGGILASADASAVALALGKEIFLIYIYL